MTTLNMILKVTNIKSTLYLERNVAIGLGILVGLTY